MVSEIKNALLVRKGSVVIPFKISCIHILKIFYKEGYINGYRVLPGNITKIEIFLKYISGKPVISKLFCLSKPGKRVYVSVDALWKLEASLRTLVLLTHKGILSDKDCKKYHVGGEIFCVIQ